MYEHVRYKIPGSIDTPEMDAMQVLSDEEWEKACYQETLGDWLAGETFTATED